MAELLLERHKNQNTVQLIPEGDRKVAVRLTLLAK